jgi:hypothetical protein
MRRMVIPTDFRRQLQKLGLKGTGSGTKKVFEINAIFASLGFWRVNSTSATTAAVVLWTAPGINGIVDRNNSRTLAP